MEIGVGYGGNRHLTPQEGRSRPLLDYNAAAREWTEGIMTRMARIAGNRLLRLVVVVSFGMTLGACSKCDVPTWQPNRAPGPPLSCHGDAPVQ
jgi:hypothetical protein